MENLNNNIWYRAVKVIFVVIFLVVQLVGFGIVAVITSEKVSFTHCDNGKEFQPATLSFDENKMDLDLFKQCDVAQYFLNSSTVKGRLTDEQQKEISGTILKMQSQGALESEMQAATNAFKTQYADQSPNPDAGKTYTTEEMTKSLGAHKFFAVQNKPTDYWTTNFVFKYKDKYPLLLKMGFYIVSFLIVSILFWLISRVFFYIALGEKIFKFKK